jgi:pilus assembly protein CpaC
MTQDRNCRLQMPVVALAVALACVSAWGQATAVAAQSAGNTADVQQSATPQTAVPQTQQSVPGAEVQAVEQQAVPLRVMVDKSLLVRTADAMKRVSVTDPAVADAIAVTPNQILIHGRSPGEVSLILWNQQEQSRTFDLRVDVDVSAAATEIRRTLPDQQIDVQALRNALVLSGHVISKEDSQRAAAVAGAFSKNVVNALTFGPVGAQEVLLQVQFAEVDRTALSQLGINLFSTGAGNTVGSTSTQQFGGFSKVTAGGQNSGGTGATGTKGAFDFNDLMNVFLFRSDINLGAVIKALQAKDLLQILAQPNLIALNGKEASFLAGGEFPFPIVQGVGSGSNVTIQFKEFGVRLSFTPTIMPNGDIYLAVKPEVSSLDFTNALNIQGLFIPALSTRRASTEFEMKDGQSFVIAGLMDKRVTKVADKIPGLGSLPIIGNFFKSQQNQKTDSELMVLVTARRVSPDTAPVALPKFPEKFMTHSGTPGK